VCGDFFVTCSTTSAGRSHTKSGRSISMRDWLKYSNHQLALFVWSGGLYCLYGIGSGPHGFAGFMQSTQGILLLVFIACSGSIGWGLIRRNPMSKWVLTGVMICQAALCIRALVISPSLKSGITALIGCWLTYELIRWDLSGTIEAGRLYLERTKYVKHKSKPKSAWSVIRSLFGWNCRRSVEGEEVVPSDPSVDNPELIMERFCGREVYPIRLAEWHFYDSRNDMRPTFHLRVEAGRGTTLHEDTESLKQEPFWTVSVVDMELTIDSFVPGAKFIVPVGYDEPRRDHVTNFFYGTHEVSDQNSIEILQAHEDRFLIRLQGQIADVNFGSSKPNSKVSVETWFMQGS
jgi:hypothetical protein